MAIRLPEPLSCGGLTLGTSKNASVVNETQKDSRGTNDVCANRALRSQGGPELSRQLGLPTRTWYNYESGITVPAEILLKFIEVTQVEPLWLLHGTEPKFRGAPSAQSTIEDSTATKFEDFVLSALQTRQSPPNGSALSRLLRWALQALEDDGATLTRPDSDPVRSKAVDNPGMKSTSEFLYNSLNSPRRNGRSNGNGSDHNHAGEV